MSAGADLAIQRKSARMRLAQHYLGKLRKAGDAVRRGRGSAAYGAQLFETEWEQIKMWQAWASDHKALDQNWAHICCDFTSVGLQVITVQGDLKEVAAWLEASLQAARLLGDTALECIYLRDLAMAYMRLGMLVEGEQATNELETIARASGNWLAVGWGLYSRAFLDEERGSYETSQRSYQQALAIFRERRADGDCGLTLHGLGSVALYLGDFETAHESFLQYYQQIATTGSKREITIALLSIGQALISLKRYDEAEDYTQQAVQICRGYRVHSVLGGALIMMGALRFELDQLDSARGYYERGIDVARKVGSTRDVIHGLSNLGYTLMRAGDLSKSIVHLNEALTLAQEGGLPRFICNIQRNLADTYLALGDQESASHALREALVLAQSLDSYPQKVRTLSSAIAVWHATGKSKQAAQWAWHIMGDAELDEEVFGPMCAQIEAALGGEGFRKAHQESTSLTLDDIISDALEHL